MMTPKIIRICYRKIIGNTASTPWERLVWDDTYAEFRLQAQLYNQEKKYRLFSELLQHAPGADALHHLVSAGAIPYLRQLHAIIPDVQNTLGKLFLPFDAYRFEIIDSHTEDKQQHVVAVSFYSNPIQWLHNVGDTMILSTGTEEGGDLLTETFRLQPFTSIYSIKDAVL